MKYLSLNYIQTIVFIIIICFVNNVYSQGICEWRTNDIEQFENCIKKQRGIYDDMLKDKKTIESNNSEMTKEELYNYLLKSYDKLIKYHSQGVNAYYPKEVEFRNDKKSLKKII